MLLSWVWVDGEYNGEFTLTVGLKLTSKSIYCSLIWLVDGIEAHRPGRPFDWTRIRTVELLMQVTTNFRCQVHTPLTMVPGHEYWLNCEHDTVTPVVAVILATGPFEDVVENLDATVRHFEYAENIIHSLVCKYKTTKFSYFSIKSVF
jgi:hypothetical protein